ncbi:MAG: hypothetical protein H6621_11775 [Halobacteriovoraceae bacterium]|nr:hypothetical protein [Halobacteriovoraceae bacterium]MCB9095739.1 hypothetical protein [Halobacteriovoraceae bacterium]
MPSLMEQVLKWNRNLASAYLVQSSRKLNSSEITTWFQNYYNRYLTSNKINKQYQNILNAPDVLFLTFPSGKNQFKIEDFKNLYSFQETKPLEGHNKFCLVYPVQALNMNIYNKLLKIIEEPLNKLSFFFFDDNNTTVPQTVSSRVMKLRASAEEFGPWTQEEQSEPKKAFAQLVQATNTPQSLQNFADLYLQNEVSEEELLQELIHWEAQNVTSGIMKEKFLQILRWAQESQTYHNSAQERCYFIYQYMKAVSSKTVPIQK